MTNVRADEGYPRKYDLDEVVNDKIEGQDRSYVIIVPIDKNTRARIYYQLTSSTFLIMMIPYGFSPTDSLGSPITKNTMKTLRDASKKPNKVETASTGTTSWTVPERALTEKLHASRRFLLPTHDAAITGHKGWYFLVSFYELSSLVARLSKCEITLCVGNTHVLKLLFWPTASEFSNLHTRPLACDPLVRFLCAWIMRRGRLKSGS